MRAGLLTSDVAFLDDPGFTVVAVARIEGEDEPRVLGRLVALPRDLAGESDAVRFRWIVRIPLDVKPVDGERTRHARLFTGSGDRGLPAGLSFGVAELPLDAAAYTEPVIEVVPDVAPDSVEALFVRTWGSDPGANGDALDDGSGG